MIHIHSVIGDALSLLIRLIIGISFIASSRNKAKNIKKFAKNNDVPVPAAVFTMIAELAGALGLIFGVLTQFAALGLMLLMVSTISLHIFKWKSPYWASRGGWEYDLMLFTLSAVILIHGGGNYVLLHKMYVVFN